MNFSFEHVLDSVFWTATFQILAKSLATRLASCLKKKTKNKKTVKLSFETNNIINHVSATKQEI